MTENPLIIGLILLCVCLTGYIGIHRGRETICKDENCGEGKQCKTVMAKDFVYMATIFAIVVVIAVSFAMYNDNTAVAYFSFAGTVTSIILSVIAIIMTIESERKSDNAKAQLDVAVQAMKEMNEELTDKVEHIKQYSDELDRKLGDRFERKLDEILAGTQVSRVENKQLTVEMPDNGLKSGVIIRRGDNGE